MGGFRALNWDLRIGTRHSETSLIDPQCRYSYEVPSDPPTHRPVKCGVILLIVAWIGLTGMLVGVGELVAHWGVIEQFDRHVTAWIVAHRSHVLDTTMKMITWAGSWVAVALTAVIVLALVAIRKLPLAIAILAAAGWVGEVTGVNLAKSLVDRQRPPRALWLTKANGASFPSGHAANAVLVFTILGFVWCLLANARTTRVLAVMVSGLGILVVGFSRIELGVHWMTDVVASYLVVAAWIFCISFLFSTRLSIPVSQPSLPRRQEDLGAEALRSRTVRSTREDNV